MAEKTLDLRGLICPRPVIITMSTLKSMEKGQTLEVYSTDSTVKESIPALCERSGYRLVHLADEDGLIHFSIQK